MRSNLISRLMPKPSPGAARRGHASPSLAARDEWGGLMIAAQNGHGGAYRRLLGEISDWLHHYFQRRLPHGDVDDAVQETLLAIHRRRHTYDPQYPLRPWLAAITKRKWIDQLRGHLRSPDSLGEIEVPVSDHGPAVRAAILLEHLLAEVKPAQAQVIKLVKLHGASVEEAARASGQSPSLVKVNVHRGLKRISRSLAEWTARDVEPTSSGGLT